MTTGSHCFVQAGTFFLTYSALPVRVKRVSCSRAIRSRSVEAESAASQVVSYDDISYLYTTDLRCANVRYTCYSPVKTWCAATDIIAIDCEGGNQFRPDCLQVYKFSSAQTLRVCTCAQRLERAVQFASGATNASLYTHLASLDRKLLNISFRAFRDRSVRRFLNFLTTMLLA